MILRRIPRGVFALGFVSMFMDMSSEMIHSVLPVFMVSVLGVSAAAVGIVEGIAESTALIVKTFSGAISDWIGKRKPLLLLGYGLAAATRPLFPMAHNVSTVLLARFTDRIGKGIRGAPRDALMADITPDGIRGAAFGLRQSLDTLGAIAGPLIAMFLMLMSGNDFRFVFTVAIIPALVVILIIVFAVREPRRETPHKKSSFPLKKRHLKELSTPFWYISFLGAALTLARFSDAFLVLRGDSLHLGAAYAPMILIVMNVAYSATAYPAGKMSDQIGEYTMLFFSILALIAADMVLAFATRATFVFFGATLWGIHMGLSQGILTSLVAREAPAHLRGTAFGMFNLLSGGATLIASLIAGALWTLSGPSATFIAGAIFAAISLAGFMLQRKRAAV